MSVYDSYLAANTPQGFVSRFDQLNRERLERLFVLKGTSGNGKSTLMRRLSERLSAEGFEVERIHCSADSDSLDCVLIPELRAAVLDGTAPHAVEPRWPFAFETVVDLYDAMDGDRIFERRQEVFDASEQYHRLMERARHLIASAGALESDSMRLQDACIDSVKLRAAAVRMARKLFGKPTGEQGSEEIRFLSAVGGETFWNTVTDRCKTLFVLEEDAGAARQYLSLIRSFGRAAGQPVVSFLCPMRPADRIEHLLFPKAGVGFVTSNAAHRFTSSEGRRVNCRRFTSLPALRRAAPGLTFDRRTERGLLRSAEEALAAAREAHDRLESVYTSALLPEILQKKEDAVFRALLSLKAAKSSGSPE